MLFLDTETTGLDWWRGHRPFLVGLAIDNEPPVIWEESEFHLLRSFLLQRKSAGETFVFFNAKFDLHMLLNIGIDLTDAIIIDVLAMARLCESDKQRTLAMKKLGEKYFPGASMEESVLKKELAHLKRKWQGDEEVNYSHLPREILDPYLTQDVSLTRLLFHHYQKLIPEKSFYVFETEMRLLPVLLNIERTGYKVNREYLSEKISEAGQELKVMEQKIYEVAGINFNILSPVQLQRILLAKGYNILDTSESTLSKLQGDLPKLILKYRELYKIQNTYLKPLYERSAIDGKIHMNFRQFGAFTGRLSCSEPNMQNLPKSSKYDVRKAFVPSSDEYILGFFDWSQIELRALADYSQDEFLLKAYKENLDIHGRTAQLIGAKPDSPDWKEWRQRGKTVNFLIVYGGGSKALLDQLGEEFTIEDAKNFLWAYKQGYPGVNRLIERVQTKVIIKRELVNRYGRVYKMSPESAYKGLNYLIQGSCADLLKRKLVAVADYLADKKSRIINNVHDEIQVEIHKSEAKEVIPKIKAIMEDCPEWCVPIIAETSISLYSWAEKRAWDGQFND